MFRKRSSVIMLMLLAFLHLVACQSDPERIGPTGPIANDSSQEMNYTVVGAVPPAPTDFAAVQEQVFETLFTQSYDPAYFAFDMTDVVSGLGSYQGQNHYGDALNLEVLFEGPIPLEDMGLSPEDLASAQAGNMHYSSILAWIEANGQRVAVSGAYFDGDVPSQGFQSRFMVTGIEDENSELFNPTPPPASGMFLGSWDPLGLRAISGPISGTSKCIQDCYDDYNAAKDAANDAHDTAVQDAQDAYDTAEQEAADTRDGAISDAYSTYDDARSSADAWLVAELLVCHTALMGGIIACTITTGIWSIFTFGLPIAACIAAAHIVYAGCTTYAITSHSSSLSAASAALTSSVNSANNAYGVAVNAAATQLQADLNAANAALQAALAQAQADLQACLNACKKEKVGKEPMINHN